MNNWKRERADGDRPLYFEYSDGATRAPWTMQTFMHRMCIAHVIGLCLVQFSGCVAPIPLRHQGSAMVPALDGRNVNTPTWNVVLSPLPDQHDRSLASRNDAQLNVANEPTSAWQRAERAADVTSLDYARSLSIHGTNERIIYFGKEPYTRQRSRGSHDRYSHNQYHWQHGPYSTKIYNTPYRTPTVTIYTVPDHTTRYRRRSRPWR